MSASRLVFRIFLGLLLVALTGFFIHQNRKNFSDRLGLSSTGSTLTGEELPIFELSGELQLSPDLTYFTHRLVTSTGEFGLRAPDLELADFYGEVELRGQLVDRIDGVPILEVSEVFPLISDQEIIQSTKRYFPSLLLALDPEFADDLIARPRSGSTREFIHTPTEKTFEISLFSCEDGFAGQTCDQFAQTFESTASQSFETSQSLRVAKSPETRSRFRRTQNFGYFATDIDEDLLLAFHRAAEFVTDDTLETIADELATLCRDRDFSLTASDERSRNFDDADGLSLIFTGSNPDEARGTCRLIVDLSRPRLAELRSLTEISSETSTGTQNLPENPDQNTGENSDEIPDENSNTSTGEISGESPRDLRTTPADRSISTPQIPLTPETPFEFSSRRGYTIFFPSQQISFAAQTVNENFDRPDFSCPVAISVIGYARRDALERAPDLQIFECDATPADLPTASHVLSQTVGEQTFLIFVRNPARRDFAKNLEISLD